MKKLNSHHINRLIHVLSLARARIESDEDEFVCNAIRHVYPTKYRGLDVESYLVSWIKKMLGDNLTFNSWHFYKTNRMASYKRLKSVRLKWVDWMINELQKELV